MKWMIYVTGGLCIFFLSVLLLILFLIWRESRRERISPCEITGETLPGELREAALRPLKVLNSYYQKRDPDQADICIDETMLADDMLILGTNTSEVFHGREGAVQLLQGDWKYWGQLSLDVERTALSKTGPGLYYVLRGSIKLDRIHFRIPIRITGILEERDGLWYIGRMQFVNDLNSNYLIVSWIPALAFIICLLLFGLSWLPNI